MSEFFAGAVKADDDIAYYPFEQKEPTMYNNVNYHNILMYEICGVTNMNTTMNISKSCEYSLHNQRFPWAEKNIN